MSAPTKQQLQVWLLELEHASAMLGDGELDRPSIRGLAEIQRAQYTKQIQLIRWALDEALPAVEREPAHVAAMAALKQERDQLRADNERLQSENDSMKARIKSLGGTSGFGPSIIS